MHTAEMWSCQRRVRVRVTQSHDYSVKTRADSRAGFICIFSPSMNSSGRRADWATCLTCCKVIWCHLWRLFVLTVVVVFDLSVWFECRQFLYVLNQWRKCVGEIMTLSDFLISETWCVFIHRLYFYYSIGLIHVNKKSFLVSVYCLAFLLCWSKLLMISVRWSVKCV